MRVRWTNEFTSGIVDIPDDEFEGLNEEEKADLIMDWVYEEVEANGYPEYEILEEKDEDEETI